MDIVTIDGPTSSGKNSVGFLLAQRLAYQYIDSGSIYRAGCIFILRQQNSPERSDGFILRQNMPPDDTEKMIEVFQNLKIEIKQADSETRIIANSEDVTDALHNRDVTRLVPIVAAIGKIREITKSIQHQLAAVQNTVMTGRDIGSEIFPDAKNKFFLTASVEVRAQRRFKQLVAKDPQVKYEDVLADMQDRDRKDSERAVSPMRIPEDAIVIDNSNLTVEQTVDEMLKRIHA